MRAQHPFSTENWPVSSGRLFPWVLCLVTSPVSWPDIPILIFRVALLGIAKFPCRRPPWGSYNSGRKIFPSLTVSVSSPHIVIIPVYAAIPMRVVLVTFWNFKITFHIKCGMLRRPGWAPLTENSRPLFWVWSLFCTFALGERAHY